jgi:hypothetical protein
VSCTSRSQEDPWNAILSGAAVGGILAARAGLKAAGKSALVGGVIMTAIEGLNIVLMRVVMPSFEASQAENVVIDRLDPPLDPLRRRALTTGAGKAFVPSSANFEAPSSGQRSGGFDLDSILSSSSSGGSSSSSSGSSNSFGSNSWDTPGFTTEGGSASSEEDEPPKAKPFYQFW